MYVIMFLVWLLVGLEISDVAVYGQSQTVTYNGVPVTNPVLVFWDEVPFSHHRSTSIGDVNSKGALVCSSTKEPPSWIFSDLIFVPVNPRAITATFHQIRSNVQETPILSRLFRGMSIDGIASINVSRYNAVFRCRVLGMDISVVTLVNRNSGHGVIQSMVVSLGPRSATHDVFTVYGDTVGGPPTNSNWMRNGAPISSGETYIISVALITNTIEAHERIQYRSTLLVRGDRSGLYTYVATNRISNQFTEHITISRRAAPTNVLAQQTGRQSVMISWDETRPDFGYRVTIGGNTFTTQESSISRSIQPGTYSLEVVALFYPVSSEPARLTIIIRDTGSLPPIVTASSVTATSATVTWRPPADSFTPRAFMIVVSRVNGSRQALCPDVEESRSIQAEMNVFMMQLTNLHEFSLYEVRVTANFSDFGGSVSQPGITEFTTDTAAPAGAPGGVTASTASRSVNVSWDAIECSERNGIIIDYVAEFEKLSGAAVRGEVMNQIFIASGLTPHTEYTFRVAGANREGQGPFSEAITLTTDEDVPGAVSNLMADVRDVFLVVMWGPPQETNGVIIVYEVAYWTSFSHTAVNTSTLSTTLILTDILNISVRAYTRVGPGPESSITLYDTTTNSFVVGDAAAVGGVGELPVISGVVAFTVVAVLLSGFIIVVMVMYLRRKLKKLNGPNHFTNPLYDDLLMENYVAENDNYMEDEDNEGAVNIVVFPSDMCAEVGERVFFRVVVTGEPYPTLSWYHNDIELKSDDCIDIQPFGSLCILSATQEHSGVYRLLAWNSGGSAEREVRLTVTQQASMKAQKSFPVPGDSADNIYNLAR